MKCLVFSLGEYNFGIEIELVKEVGKKKNAKYIKKKDDSIIIKYRDNYFFVLDLNDIFQTHSVSENIIFPTIYNNIAIYIGKIKGIYDIVYKNIISSILDTRYIKSFVEVNSENVFIIDLELILKSKKIKRLKAI